MRAAHFAWDAARTAALLPRAALHARFGRAARSGVRSDVEPDAQILHLLVEGDPRHGLSPAARYRACQYVPLLEEQGLRCRVLPSRPGKYFGAGARFQRWYRRGPRLAGMVALCQHARQAWNRKRDFRKLEGHGVVFLQRDLVAGLDGRLEERLRLHNRRIVFDFDDAIYTLPPWSSGREAERVARGLEAKIGRICSLASVVIVSNEHLATFARAHNDCVHVLPTCLDSQEFRPAETRPKNATPVIGWVGTSGNLYYLRAIAPALRELSRDQDFALRVVCNEVDPSELPDLPGLEFVRWNQEQEVARIQAFDIGIMPLLDDPWSRGKAGFKLVQYMACGVPSVASRVGANPDVLGPAGECGLLCDSEKDWVAALARLLDDEELRRRLGKAGRARAVARFDRRAQAGALHRIIQQAAALG